MEEFPKSTNEQTKMEIEELSQDRINFKLSLRKKKFNDMLIKKRILPSKPEDSPWPLELFLSNLKLPADYKIIFAKEDEFLSTAFKNIKSEDILNVKYGICLLGLSCPFSHEPEQILSQEIPKKSLNKEFDTLLKTLDNEDDNFQQSSQNFPAAFSRLR